MVFCQLHIGKYEEISIIFVHHCIPGLFNEYLWHGIIRLEEKTIMTSENLLSSNNLFGPEMLMTSTSQCYENVLFREMSMDSGKMTSISSR